MSARDHSAGREIVDGVEDFLHGGAKVRLYIRARADPVTVTRVNRAQFTVRLFTQDGESLDVAYSAIESARYKRPLTSDLLDG